MSHSLGGKELGKLIKFLMHDHLVITLIFIFLLSLYIYNCSIKLSMYCIS